MKGGVDAEHGPAETRLQLWRSSWIRFFETLRCLATDPTTVFDQVADGKLPSQPHFAEQLAYVSLAIGIAYQPIAHFLRLPHFSLLNWIGDVPSVILFLFVVSLLLLVLPLVLTRVQAAFFFLAGKVVGGLGTFHLTRVASDIADAPLIFLGFFLSAGSLWLSLLVILLDYLLTMFAMTKIHRRPFSTILLGQAIGIACLGLIGGLVFYFQKG
jgi:hypothetical protein